MNRPYKVSFWVLIGALVLTAVFHLGVVLLSSLFSYLLLTKLEWRFARPRSKGVAIFVFLVIVAGMIYGITSLVEATATALPGIAEKAAPAFLTWAREHRIALPFHDVNGLKDEVVKNVTNGAKSLGLFADFAKGATKEMVYFIVGMVVAICIFLNPHLEMDEVKGDNRHNLYTLCCEEITKRFSNFYHSFALVMKAQVIISAIDATATGIFLTLMGFNYLVVAVGATFVCGLLPIVGNLLSNTLITGIGFVISPSKGLGALAFLVAMHQFEYFLNSKIIGGRIRTPFWMTLLGLVLGDCLMGVPGIILAPVVLHYIRVEASEVKVKAE